MILLKFGVSSVIARTIYQFRDLPHASGLHSDSFCVLSTHVPPYSDEDELSVGSGDAADDVCECSSGVFDDTLGLCGEVISICPICREAFRANA